MNVVIAGMGEVGLHVASRLAGEGHRLTVIDESPAAVARAEETLDALSFQGSADAPRTLREAGAKDADLFAALTSSGPVNIIACLRAKEMGARRVVARVSEKHYFEDARGVYPGYMGLDLVVNEQFVVAAELHRLVRSQSAAAIDVFADRRAEMVEILVDGPAPAVDRPLGEVGLPEDARVVALMRRDTVLVPNPGDVVQVGDRVVTLGAATATPAVERLFCQEEKRASRRTVIVGGGRSGLALAEALERGPARVILIERDKERCHELSTLLQRTFVYHGDGTDAHVLEEYGAAGADVFCAVSGLDEVNLMASLLAKDLGARRCVTLVHKPDYVKVLSRLGLQISVSPRLLVARELVRQLRSGCEIQVAEVLGGHGLVLELEVEAGVRLAGKALGDLALPRGAAVGLHVSGDRVRVPSRDSVFEVGDRLVVFALRDARQAVERLFKRPLLGGGG